MPQNTHQQIYNPNVSFQFLQKVTGGETYDAVSFCPMCMYIFLVLHKTLVCGIQYFAAVVVLAHRGF